MSALSLDAAARHVLTRYPAALRQGDLIALGNHRGFSGARIWRLQGSRGALCLRAWPPGDPSPERLRFLHRLMILARESGVDSVPALFAGEDGHTGVEHAGRLWELTAWMPGRADYHDRPTAPRLRAACAELARLHRAWGGAMPSAGPCPAVGRRLARVRDWQRHMAGGWRPAFVQGVADPVQPWAERAWDLLRQWADRVPRLLESWQGRRVPLQPCLCDIWHEHVLYEADRVAGLIDFGAAKVDHVSADLARLLGSLAGDDAGGWSTGLEAYRAVRGLSAEEEALAGVLDQTGAIVGAMTWLRWLYRDARDIEDRPAAASRLAGLVKRIEGL
jgi:Ser/Thr protein kinase RdoA (MazF antagonist)